MHVLIAVVAGKRKNDLTIDCSHFEWLKIYVKLLDARPALKA